MTIAPPSAALSSISDVERDTGVPKETLRVWERRYGFPQPERDANGERLYPAAQIVRLRLVKRLLDQGYRPGKIMHHNEAQLSELAAKMASPLPVSSIDNPELQLCLDLIKEHKMQELRQRLLQSLLQNGLKHFVTDMAAPLTTLVGDAWSAGRLAVFEEHLYSEVVQGVLHNAIFSANQQNGQAQRAPRILLTTVPQERHGLGLLMAEALLALEGAHCISLGVQTPLADIVNAAQAQKADIVALSFSSVMSPRATIDNVTELQNRLGPDTLVWAGGGCAALVRRQLGPLCVLDLHDIGAALTRWRSQHGTPAI
jgi:DNA-binding transcriptional MerR regulator/methylmalonyl-CoA mutase cobalamin-binding subunit